MDVRPYYEALGQLLQRYADKLLSPTAVQLLGGDVRRLLDSVVHRMMSERMYLIRAAELRSLGAQLPPAITDEMLVACRQQAARADGKVGLVIEATYGLPAEVHTLEAESIGQEKAEPETQGDDGSAAGP